MTTKYTKPAPPGAPATPETPVFPKEIHQTRPPVAAVLPHQKPAKRDNVFSQSKVEFISGFRPILWQFSMK